MTSSANYTPEEPIVAVATALAPAAMGIVRCSGKNCIELVAKFFSRPKALLSASPSSMLYGWIINPVGSVQVDEVMLGVHKAPRSFTGEDMVEVFCHGGVAVVKAVLSVFLNNGFRQAERGEFTFRSYINGKSDLTKAEAVKEIIDSKTDFSRSRAAGRLSGSLYTETEAIKKFIIDTLAAIEVEIEYPEDEETIKDSFDETALLNAQDRLKTLSDSWKSEKVYQDGIRVVLCGRTNAGKSSLFNALLKEDRAIVSNIEGTTRDWLESYVDFDGLPVRLFDTAGLRATDDVIEALGVERTKDLTLEADVILYLVDSSCGLNEADNDFLSRSKSYDIPIVLVWNKCDSDSSMPLPMDKGAWNSAVCISSKTGSGISALVKEVCSLLENVTLSEKSNNIAVGSDRQHKCVQEAYERVSHAISSANDGYSLDAIVQDLEDALDSLGEVTGEVTPDDILESIFSNFCVGK